MLDSASIDSDEPARALLEEVPEESQREKNVKHVARLPIPIGVLNTFVSIGKPVHITILSALSTTGVALLAPTSRDNERDLKEIIATLEDCDVAKGRIKKFKKENKALRAQLRKLKAAVRNMENTQETLDTITKQQTQSIDDFEKQVQKQKELLREMQEDARSGMLQMLLTFIVANDVDGDFKIDPEEVDPLVDSIEGSKSLGVNRELFRTKVEENNGEIQAVLDMCADIMQPPEDDEGEDRGLREDQVFWIIEK